MKKVLVTGGTGLVGKAIDLVVAQENPIDEKWYFVGSKDADLRNLDATKLLFENYQPNYVIHLAAMVGGLFYNIDNNLDFLRTNMQINDNVLQTAYEYNCKKVISCLSTCIFPNETTYPIDETMIHNGPPHKSNYGYSYAKRLIDIQNHAYHDKYDCLFTSIIPCNIFGPYDNFKPNVSHVIPGMIYRMYELIHSNTNIPEEEKIFEVYGSGKPLRQFIYSEDLAKLILWVLRAYDNVEPIILCVDEDQEVSIYDVAKTIAEAFNFKGKLSCNTNMPDGQFKKTASNRKMRSLLPDFQFTSFKEAIQRSVNWYCQHYDEARK